MSWSLSATNVNRNSAVDHMRALKDEQGKLQTSEGQWSEGVEAQMETAFDALQVLLASVKGQHININMGGHARGQYENDQDTVNINVSGTYLPPPSEETPEDDAEEAP